MHLYGGRRRQLSRQSSQPGPISQGSINGQTGLSRCRPGTRAATIAPISAPSRRFDHAGQRISIVLAAAVIGVDVFVVRREYCRMDLSV
jgi:hypothetical protein